MNSLKRGVLISKSMGEMEEDPITTYLRMKNMLQIVTDIPIQKLCQTYEISMDNLTDNALECLQKDIPNCIIDHNTRIVQINETVTNPNVVYRIYEINK